MLAVAIAVVSVSAQAASCQSVAALSPLLGVWQAQDGKQQEHWQRAGELTLEGRMVTLEDSERQVTKEYMRIVSMGDEIFYLAKVAHNALPVAFKMITCSNETWTFENAGHDFPTQLIYRIQNQTNLAVDVKGRNGKGFTLMFEKLKASP